MNDKIQKIKNGFIDRYFEVVETDEDEDDPKQTKASQAAVAKHKPEEKPKESIVKQAQTAIKYHENEKAAHEPTIISKGTEIQGHINAENDLQIKGKVVGNIHINGHLIIDNAIIVGDIIAQKITIISSNIKGHIESYSQLEIQQDSIIEGDMKGQNIFIACQCNGNIDCGELLHLSSTAHTTGDILTKHLKIDENAILNGQIKMAKKE